MGTTPTDFSGREIVSVFRDHGFNIVDRTGSHVKLRRIDPNTGNVRNVTVPQYDVWISISCTKSLHSLGQTIFIGGAAGSIGADKMDDTTPEPVSDEALTELKQKMDEQRPEIREALADDLGTDPTDYRHQDE